MSAPDHLGDKLSAYLDGELPGAERTAVEQHLRECAACGRLLEDMATVDSTARALGVEAPDGYFDAFPARVRARLSARRARTIPAWTWAAAAAVLLAVVTPLTMVKRQEAPAAAPAAREQARPEDLKARVNAPVGTDQAAPPTTASPATREQLESLGYAGDVPSQREMKADELRQRQILSLDRRRLNERDAELSARAVPDGTGRRSTDLKDDALKKEAGPAGAAATDKLAANAAGAPASAAVPPQVPVAEEEAQARAKRADTPALRGVGGLSGGRAEPARATPPPPPPTTVIPKPAAPPPAQAPSVQAEAPRDQGFASRPSPAEEGALGSSKAAEAYERTVDADAYGEPFAALASRPMRTAEEARKVSRDWSELARRAPQAPGADEARVRSIEAMATAWRLEGKDADRAQARRLADAYLAAAGPRKDRVRAVVQSLER